ncbi:MAG: hypothetical protein V7636_882 [Actinomycetota bacterium]
MPVVDEASVVDPDDLYDWSAFDAAPRREVRTTRRGAVPLAAALWAVSDVVLGERRVDPVVEEVPMPTPDPDQRVVVHLVWGEPRLSYAILRS